MLQEPCLSKPYLKIGSNQWRSGWLTVGRGFLVFDLDDKLTRHHQCPSPTAEQAVNGTGLTSPITPRAERFQSLLALRRACTSLGNHTGDKVRRDTIWCVPSSKLGAIRMGASAGLDLGLLDTGRGTGSLQATIMTEALHRFE